MLHRLFLCIGLKLSSDSLIEMHSVGRLIVAVMAERHRETVIIGCSSIRTTEYVMNLYPPPGATYKALFLVTDN